MKLTKYAHACFTVEKDDQLLVVDPGEFSTDFIAPANVVAVILTHEHADHFDHEQLAAIVDKNPEAIIIGPAAVTSKIEAFETKTVDAGDNLTVGPFRFEFFGGQHATIDPSIPTITNIGVIINDLVCYPGDSLALPGKPIDTLALPIAAPWVKISEVMQYAATVSPRLAFPTHDAILSVEGKEVFDANIGNFAGSKGIVYQRLEAPLDI